MKPFITFLLLSAMLAFPTATTAEFLGARVPSLMSGSTAVGFFAAALTLALLVAEYGRRQPPLRAGESDFTRRAGSVLLPISDAFAETGTVEKVGALRPRTTRRVSALIGP